MEQPFDINALAGTLAAMAKRGGAVVVQAPGLLVLRWDLDDQRTTATPYRNSDAVRPASPPEVRHLSIAEAAERCAVSPSTLNRWRRRGDLPSVDILGRVMIDPKDLQDFMDAHRTRPKK